MGRPLTWNDLTQKQAEQLRAFVSEEHVLTLKGEERLVDRADLNFRETSAMIADALEEARAVVREHGPAGLMEWAEEARQLAVGFDHLLAARIRSNVDGGTGLQSARGNPPPSQWDYVRQYREETDRRAIELAREADDGTVTARLLPRIRWAAGVYVNQFEMRKEGRAQPWPGWSDRLEIDAPLEILAFPHEAPEPPELPQPTKAEQALTAAREITSAVNPHRYRDYRLLRNHEGGDHLPNKLLEDIAERVGTSTRSVRRYLVRGGFELPDELRYGL